MKYEFKDVRAFATAIQTRSIVIEPTSLEQIQEALNFSKRNGYSICLRGGGYSYADMILNHRNVVLDLKHLNQVKSWDPNTGWITVEPGVYFSEILKLVLPDRWTLAACPGGLHVTVGGAISNNIHGKDSWRLGNFGNQVVAMKLLVASGEVWEISREKNCELFKAVIGGMGLLGVIVEATLQLQSIPSCYVQARVESARNIEEVVEKMNLATANSHFSVAWVDSFAKGPKLGRGFVTSARWVDVSKPLPRARFEDSLRLSSKVFDVIPAEPFWKMVKPLFGPMGIRNVNRFNYYKSVWAHGPKGKTFEPVLFSEYNFMHNRIPKLDHVYHPEGFLEFQPLVPRNGAVLSNLRALFELCQRHGSESLLCGLKLHKEDEFLISYSGDGYSVGIDIQLRNRAPQAVHAFSRELYDFSSGVNSKVYLAKDERLDSGNFKKMYPAWDSFLKVKREIDPGSLFSSNLYRRLFC